MTDVKICGVKTPEALTAAIEGGARFVGFVFYPPSPRFIDPSVAAYLAGFVPQTVRIVGLFVDPSDEELEKVLREVRLDMLQLHGSESPGRLMEIKKKFGLPLIKAVKVAAKSDLDCLPGFEASADWIPLMPGKTNPLQTSPAETACPSTGHCCRIFAAKILLKNHGCWPAA